MLCQLTDVDPDKVAIGDELEMTFRRLYTAGGVHNYFWKAAPEALKIDRNHGSVRRTTKEHQWPARESVIA